MTRSIMAVMAVMVGMVLGLGACDQPTDPAEHRTANLTLDLPAGATVAYIKLESTAPIHAVAAGYGDVSVYVAQWANGSSIVLIVAEHSMPSRTPLRVTLPATAAVTAKLLSAS